MERLGLSARGTLLHGVHPPECKDATASHAIRRLPFAPKLVIPLSQHTGAPAIPIVREGQEVVRGEPIAEADGYVSVPMHAPVTGVVESIGLAKNAKGEMASAITIASSLDSDQAILFGAPQDIEAMNAEQLIKAVQATGVVGLGGAAFPTHVKLAPPDGKKVETIIVNGCECEPYLTTDHRVMLEKPQGILTGIRIVSRALGANNVVIATERNKSDAAQVLTKATADHDDISVVSLKTKYPQGAEKMLTKSLLGREIPSGGLPIDVGVAVFNVATLAQIGDLLPRQQGLIERVITVTGPAVGRPGNYLVALGTPLQFILDHADVTLGAIEVILGGPMMGAAVSTIDVPVTKGVTGILVLHRNGSSEPSRKVFPCIKCGECLKACPLKLNPSHLGLLGKMRRYEEMERDYHLNDCFECGCCSYVCPSSIPLVQYFRIAKVSNRESRATP